MDATFRIIHATHKRVLWQRRLSSGSAVPIHTVTLDQPLVLLINAGYCSTSEGLLFHHPDLNDQQKKSKSSGINSANDLPESETSVIILSDTVGQRLRLKVENFEGGGGQRHLIVYCPFWIVNTSQYSFRIREEGCIHLPAGTVTAQK